MSLLVDLGIPRITKHYPNNDYTNKRINEYTNQPNTGRFFDSWPGYMYCLYQPFVRTTRSKWQDNVRKWAGNRMSWQRMIPFYPPSWYCRKPERRRCAISQPRVQPWVLEAKPIKFPRRWKESTDWCNSRERVIRYPLISWLANEFISRFGNSPNNETLPE